MGEVDSPAPAAPARVHSSTWRVGPADVDTEGAARFDALAPCLQDGATDEAVARVEGRTRIVAPRRPRYGRARQLSTWCSGTGPTRAERRTTITGEDGRRLGSREAA